MTPTWGRALVLAAALAATHLLLQTSKGLKASTPGPCPSHPRAGSKLEVPAALQLVQQQQQQEQHQLLGSGQGQLSPAAAAATGAAAAAAPRRSALPPPFNWTYYLEMNEDVRAQGYTTQAASAAHYRDKGRFQGRLARPLCTILRYGSARGLCNQLYSHLPALVLARALGGEAVLPPFFSRRSFDSAVVDVVAPIEGVLDVERMQRYWAARGLVLHKTPPLAPQFGDPLYDTSSSSAAGPLCLTATIRENLNYKQLPLGKLLRLARGAIAEAARVVLKGNPDAEIECIYLDTTVTFFALEASSARAQVEEVARGLFFNSTLLAAADRASARLASGGGFNGVHLRLEADSGWVAKLGGMESAKRRFMDVMRDVGFNSSTDVYLASGLDAAGVEAVAAELRRARLCREAFHKEAIFPAALLQGLLPEQAALLDLLVLRGAGQLVGTSASSFAFFLRELRALEGGPRGSSHWVRHPDMDNLAIFERLGVLS